ncbi:globin family protein [Deinococcus alpinitundrae]|uniref:globin family protein n=1 Tax=Deinococcus alpinitundrae TaxID=468913 RepID=UPI00137ACC95|nr:globin family protein [Deinococcus alpinitundrae]
MNAHQVQLVQHSFTQVQPIAEIASDLFYARLFELDPSLKPLFRGNMQAQGHKLMMMLGVAVANLNRPEVVMPALQRLGERHAGYGVTDAHYATVGAALLWTLEQGLGDAFTAEVRLAWEAVYGLVAETMQQAARRMTALEASPVRRSLI